MNQDEEKEITNSDLLEAMNRSFSKMEERMATKEDLDLVRLDVSGLKTGLEQVRVDLQSFKVETRENFEKLGNNIKDSEENIAGIVKDYHPHIIALEEKVFGHSILAES